MQHKSEILVEKFYPQTAKGGTSVMAAVDSNYNSPERQQALLNDSSVDS